MRAALAIRSVFGRTKFWREDSGAGTAFALFAMIFCLVISGLAIDSGNALRHRELLRLSTDVAAHAGTSALARSGDPEMALVAADAAIKLNTPMRTYGRVLADPFSDIEALHYDPDSNMLTPGGTPNAVSVHLQRSTLVGNPVPTFLLKLIGVSSWDVNSTSVVALVPTKRCNPGGGIYSHDRISLEGENVIGQQFCLHGQRGLDLAGRTNFETHSSLSMPDLSDCAGNCNENSSAGFDTASTELNLVMRTPGEQIEALQAGFLDEQNEIPEEATFFASRQIDEDLSALDELGIDTSALDTGALVSLTSEMFDRARMLPAGLIYKISCGSDGTEELQIGHQNKESVIADAIGSIRNTTSSGASEGEDADWWDVNEGNEPPPEDDEGGPEATNLPTFRNVVIVTDCRLHLTEFADIQGSLVLATHIQSGLVLTANPGASAGDQNLDCAADRQSIFMVRGNALIPPSLTASNASFIIDGEALVTGDLAGGIAMHLGMSLHASGRVKFDGKHSFEACSGNLDMALPELKVIKYVLPTDPLR